MDLIALYDWITGYMDTIRVEKELIEKGILIDFDFVTY